MNRLEELDEAIGGEKDLKTKHRMFSVRTVLKFGHSAKHAAEILDVTDRCIRNWVKKFKDGGL